MFEIQAALLICDWPDKLRGFLRFTLPCDCNEQMSTSGLKACRWEGRVRSLQTGLGDAGGAGTWGKALEEEENKTSLHNLTLPWLCK